MKFIAIYLTPNNEFVVEYISSFNSGTACVEALLTANHNGWIFKGIHDNEF